MLIDQVPCPFSRRRETLLSFCSFKSLGIPHVDSITGQNVLNSSCSDNNEMNFDIFFPLNSTIKAKRWPQALESGRDDFPLGV